jgi:dipeptidyl aminopeptidase/acylaminoacyl peptidase
VKKTSTARKSSVRPSSKPALKTLYQKPDAVVDRILHSDTFSIPIFNQQKTALIKRFAEEMPPIRYVARPQLKLAGERFNPENYTGISNYYFKRLAYFDLQKKKEQTIPFPKEAILRETLWSPDGKHLAVSVEKEDGQEVWLVKIPSLKIKKIQGVQLNAILDRTMEWIGNDQLFLRVRTEKQIGAVQKEKETPVGPVIQESGGVVSQNRTHPDLIKSAQDERVFAEAISSQLLIYDLKSGKKKKVGKAGLFGRASLSPNQKWLIVDTFTLPFSKSVPLGLFAKKTEIWNLSAKVVHTFPDSPAFENLPIQGVRTGARSIQWIQSEPETLIFAEALDQGDWAVKVEHRDELFRLKISAKPGKRESFFKCKNRFAGFTCLNEPNSYLITDYERDTEWVTTFWHHLASKEWITKTVFSLNENDSYADPGNEVMIRNAMGRPVIAIQESDGVKSIFLNGAGATPEGERPFLRKFNLETLETRELFRSVGGSYERFFAFTDESFTEILTSYESQKESPRFYARKLGAEKPTLLYADPNPYAILSRVRKEVITYERADGAKLSGILYYPLDYVEGKKYPAIIQGYPLEYTDASTAGQVRGSQDKFSTPFREDMIYNTLRGYFLLDEAQMPIIGHPETKNDQFIEQLVSSAKAAVDTLVARGLVDEKRVGIVGHSYGAYMVANLLTHSDLFATGVAKSGAYNRTLTPFGFQGERRPLWKAKDVYLKMSPFLVADQMKKPILLIHGMEDNNTGTFTMQSERYFEALKGQGAHARLVLLPEESHGYASIESIEHTLYEIFTWFDRYLKNP